jgi:hypothetical protein
MDSKLKGKAYQIIECYVKDMSYRQMQKEKGYHPEEIRRTIKEGLKYFLQHYGEDSNEFVNKTE